jgi:hypothetical protein
MPTFLVKTKKTETKLEQTLDDALVGIMSCMMAIASVAPVAGIGYAVYRLASAVSKERRGRERRKLVRVKEGAEDEDGKKERENKEGAEDEDGKKERENYIWVWKRAAAVVGCMILYRAFVNSRASQRYRTWFKHLPIWRSFHRYVDYTIVDASRRRQVSPLEQKVLGIVPHGLMPYPLALAAASPEAERSAFGSFRVVAATATKVLPGLAAFIRSIDGVDASRASVDAAMAAGQSMAVSPGGIEEMFIGCPSRELEKGEEGALLSNRKGFLRLCVKHGVPAVPVFAFGASKMMRRLNVPGAETLSKMLRASVIVIYGRLGLPIPFRTKLWYVMGDPIWPNEGMVEEENVESMHSAFCEEIHRIFEENKGIYDESWEGKTVRRGFRGGGGGASSGVGSKPLLFLVPPISLAFRPNYFHDLLQSSQLRIV